MPGNTIKINKCNELEWYIGDSQMDKLIDFLDSIGFKINSDDSKIRLQCAILDETCVDCCEQCEAAGNSIKCQKTMIEANDNNFNMRNQFYKESKNTPKTEGCLCQNCNEYYKVDLLISDEIWEKIRPDNKPKEGGLLCGSCIMKKLEAQNEYGRLKIVEVF